MPYIDRETQRAYQRAWRAKRRSDFFAGKVCARCGSAENLELDHIDRTTKVSHAIWSWSEARRQAELAKCQVLCAECHKDKTQADQGTRPRQGSRVRVVSKGVSLSSVPRRSCSLGEGLEGSHRQAVLLLQKGQINAIVAQSGQSASVVTRKPVGFESPRWPHADVAQRPERPLRKRRVVGSTPTVGSIDARRCLSSLRTATLRIARIN